MKPFKFFKNNESTFHERLRDLSEQVIEAYSRRTINRNYYTNVNMTQPVLNAVIDAINICNRMDIRYENYEHFFDMSGRAFKLKVLDIRRYTNPVYSYFNIRYKMCTSNMNLDEGMVITQLRLEIEDYYRLIHVIDDTI